MGISRRSLLIAGSSAVALAATGCSGGTAKSAGPQGAVKSLTYPAMAAHRGGLALYPESTMMAFETVAGDYPEAVLEMDVRTLRDGRMVIFHDEKVGRISTKSHAAVADMDAQAWSALRIVDPRGGPAQPAVFLDDVLERFGDTGRVLMIERKGSTDVTAFMTALRPFASQVILQDFNARNAETMTKGGFDVVQLTGKKAPSIIHGIYALGVSSPAITKSLCQRAHDQGTVVWAWGDGVVNGDPRLASMGVDGFIVNDPSRRS